MNNFIAINHPKSSVEGASMKMRAKLLFSGAVSVLLLIGASTNVLADTPQLTPQLKQKVKIKKPHLQPRYSCPPGWHLSHGKFLADSTTICVPTSKKIICPPGTNAYAAPCELGCMQIPK